MPPAQKSFRREERIPEILAPRGSGAGLVPTFSASGPCPRYEPWHDKRAGHTFIRRDLGEWLHYYYHFIDEMLGLCFSPS